MSTEAIETKISFWTRLAEEALAESKKQAERQHETELRLVEMGGDLKAILARLDDGAKKFTVIEAVATVQERKLEGLETFRTEIKTAIGLVPWLTRAAWLLLGAVGIGGAYLAGLILSGHLPK